MYCLKCSLYSLLEKYKKHKSILDCVFICNKCRVFVNELPTCALGGINKNGTTEYHIDLLIQFP